MRRISTLSACLAVAAAPLLAACEPTPPPPPQPERVLLHFQAVPGTQIAYGDYPPLTEAWVAGPDPDDPDSCNPVVVDDTLTTTIAPPRPNSAPVHVLTGGELVVEVDNVEECWTRSDEPGGWDQSLYSVYFYDGYESLAGFDPVSTFMADMRAFIIVK